MQIDVDEPMYRVCLHHAVLFTAADAHMRAYDLWVPGDTVASESEDHRRWALAIMRHSMAAETRPTTELTLTDWLSRDP